MVNINQTIAEKELNLINKHKSTCMFKDSSHIRRKNILRTKVDNEFIDASYDIYCTCCDSYLWSYHWNTIIEKDREEEITND